MEIEDNSLRDLHNSSYDTKVEFNNCFIISAKEFAYLFLVKRQ